MRNVRGRFAALRLGVALWALAGCAGTSAHVVQPHPTKPFWLDDNCALIEDAYYFVGAGRGEDFAAILYSALLGAKTNAAACVFDTSLHLHFGGDAGSTAAQIGLDLGSVPWQGFSRVPDRQWSDGEVTYIEYTWPVGEIARAKEKIRDLLSAAEEQQRVRAEIEAKNRLLTVRRSHLQQLDTLIHEREGLMTEERHRISRLQAQDLSLGQLENTITTKITAIEQAVHNDRHRNELLAQALHTVPCGFSWSKLRDILGPTDREDTCRHYYGEFEIFACDDRVTSIQEGYGSGRYLVSCRR